MHGVGAAAARHRQQLVDIEVGVGRAVALQAERLVGHARVQRVEIGVGVDRDGLHAVIGASADDAHRDFATVGDEDFLHGWHIQVIAL
ncbi:hypothetical protein G6F63_015580 [Rhizopus arrhizus]|nr:hypothetical protein G6F63_015580 [Rhizopus arrhizus]